MSARVPECQASGMKVRQIYPGTLTPSGCKAPHLHLQKGLGAYSGGLFWGPCCINQDCRQNPGAYTMVYYGILWYTSCYHLQYLLLRGSLYFDQPTNGNRRSGQQKKLLPSLADSSRYGGWAYHLVSACNDPCVPSGKHTKNYGKSPFLMGKLTINGHFQ